jgi:hypothetical protein
LNHSSFTTIRLVVVVATVVSFVAISSYLFIGSPTFSDRNQNLTNSTQQLISTESIQSSTPVYNFGNHYFEPPSAILISAYTLVWTSFQLDNNSNFYLTASFAVYPFSDLNGTIFTVAIYLSGKLVANSTTTMPDNNYKINPSSMPSSTSANSIFALTGMTPTVGATAETPSAISLNSATISFAIVSDRPIWLAGWTQSDMSSGSGPQFGASAGQLAETYEALEPGTNLPNSLPLATTSQPFELQVLGGLFA